MTTKLAILLAVLLGGMSCVFLLPRQLGYQPVGVKMELPKFLGGWWGDDAEVTEKEKQVLVDSDFARKNYVNGRGDRVLVSIVLSGQDMMTGIHRPERCLQAQGWTTGASAKRTLAIPGRAPLAVTRLRNTRKLFQDDKVYDVENLAYYWFIGYQSQVATHERRVFVDSLDRIVRGYNQRWAMVLIASEPKLFRPDGQAERETERQLEEVAKLVAPKITQESVGS